MRIISRQYKINIALCRVALVITLIFGPASIFMFAQGSDYPPSNDNFENATFIEDYEGAIQGNLLGATVQPEEPLADKGYATVWYAWTAPADRSMTFTIASEFGSTVGISVFTGDYVGKLNFLATGQYKDRITMIVNEGQEYKIQASAKTPEHLDQFYLTWNVNRAESSKQFDFDGPDNALGEPERGHSDFAIFRWWTIMTSGAPQWWIWSDRTATANVYAFGSVLVPMHYNTADYDGDEKADIAIFYPDTGLFWIFQSSNLAFRIETWGMSSDIPIKGDFDGDDIADVGIWRAETASFWIKRSSDGSVLLRNWGLFSDKPSLADYDGDGLTDFAVTRDEEMQKTFYILMSSDQQFVVRSFGVTGDTVFPGDFDADGKADIAVFRPMDATFHYIRSWDQTYFAAALPPEFQPYEDLAPGDYFGGPASDLCAWRYGSQGVFYCLADGGTAPLVNTFQFGVQGDEPIASRGIH